MTQFIHFVALTYVTKLHTINTKVHHTTAGPLPKQGQWNPILMLPNGEDGCLLGSCTV
jgi:hypothetical protein